MFRTLTVLVLAIATFTAAPAAVAADTYAVDVAHSSLLFRISHLGIGYVHGRFNEFEGSFVIDAENPNASSVHVTVKVASVDTNSEKRDQHLKSPDFFDAKQYPTMTFKSTAVARTGDDYRVTGDFTLHGVTKSLTLRLKKVGEGDDPWGNHRMGFEGQVVIKRSDFNMKYMLPGIGDDVQITLAIEGTRK